VAGAVVAFIDMLATGSEDARGYLENTMAMATESDYILATHDMNGYKAPYTGFCEHY
jgi:hypothetical protein